MDMKSGTERCQPKAGRRLGRTSALVAEQGMLLAVGFGCSAPPEWSAAGGEQCLVKQAPLHARVYQRLQRGVWRLPPGMVRAGGD